MAQNVENNVVSMDFDNSKFEKNTKKTMGTLDKLKKALNFDKSAESLNELDKASQQVDMSELTASVEGVGSKFSAMEVVAITALANITNSAMNAGKQMLSSLTIGPITAGWGKYDEKTQAVQTIMNATGKTIDEVNASLDKLIWYTDETSYSFTDMVSNIGKFTSMGVDLDESVTAMEGISNWAAVSGAGIAEASRAMYNLSQAMGAGAVKLMDWKSIENAGMATESFKNNAIAAAKALGVINKEGKTTKGTLVDTKNFTQTLAEGWFSKDVLMETLKTYGAYTDAVYELADSYDTCAEAMAHVSEEGLEVGAQAFKAAQEAKTFGDAINSVRDAVASGWMQSFEHIFGNYEEAKVLWTDLANTLWDMFASGGEGRNDLLSEWKELADDSGTTGREYFVQGLFNALEALQTVIDNVKEAFEEIIPPATAKNLFDLTKKFAEFTEKLILSEEAATKLRDVVKIVASVFSMVGSILKSVFGVIKNMVPYIMILVNDVMQMVGIFAQYFAQLADGIKKTTIFSDIMMAVANVFNYMIGIMHKLMQILIKIMQLPIINDMVNAFKELFNIMKQKFISPFFDGMNSMLNGTSKKLDGFKKTLSTFSDAFGKFWAAVKDMFASFSFLDMIKGMLEIVMDLISRCIDLVIKLIKGLAGAINEVNFKDLMVGLTSSFSAIFMAMMMGFKADFSQFVSIFKDIVKGFQDIMEGFGDVIEAEANKIKAEGILKFAIALAVLAVAMYVLSEIDYAKIVSGTAALAALSAMLVTAAKNISLIGGNTMMDTLKNFVKMSSMSKFFIKFAAAVLILAIALRMVGTLETDQLLRGVAGIAAIIAMLVIVAKIVSKNQKKMSTGIKGILGFSIAVLIIANACKTLALIDADALGRSLLALGAILLMLLIFVVALKNLTKNTKGMVGVGIAMIAMGAALMIMSNAVAKLGSLDDKSLKKGLLAIAALLLGMLVVVKALSGSKILGAANGILVMSLGISVLSKSLVSLAKLDIKQMGIALLGLFGGLVILIAALKVLSQMKGLAKAVATLIIVSFALAALALVLRVLGGMSWQAVGTALAALGGGLFVLAYGLQAMSGTLKGAASLIVASFALLIFSAALLILGAIPWQALLIGIGVIAVFIAVLVIAANLVTPVIGPLMALAGALFLIALAAVLLGVALIAISLGIMLFGQAIGMLLSGFGVGLSTFFEGIIAIIKGVISLIPYIIQAVGETLLGILDILIQALPKILVIIGELLKGIIKLLIEVLPDLLVLIGNLIVGICQLLIENIPIIVETIFQVIMAILQGIIDHLPQILAMVFTILVEIVEGLFAGIARLIPSIISNLFDMIIKICDGIAKTIRNKGERLINSIFDCLMAFVDLLVKAIEDAGTFFAEAGRKIGMGLLNGLLNSLGPLGDALRGIFGIAKETTEEELEIHSPSRVFYRYGQYTGEGFMLGLEDTQEDIAKVTAETGDVAIDTMKDTLSTISDVLESDIDSEPTIRPVVDLTEVESGAKQIDEMMASKDYDFSGTVNLADATSGTISAAEHGFGYEDSKTLKDILDVVKQISDKNFEGGDINVEVNNSDPVNIAERIGQIIQEEIERRKAVWA